MRAAAILLALALALAAPAQAQEPRKFEVAGVPADDMLNLRRGPGLGYRVVVGLPNGTVLRNRGCQRVGGTRWCEVVLDEAPRLRGFVSADYLRDR